MNGQTTVDGEEEAGAGAADEDDEEEDAAAAAAELDAMLLVSVRKIDIACFPSLLIESSTHSERMNERRQSSRRVSGAQHTVIRRAACAGGVEWQGRRRASKQAGRESEGRRHTFISLTFRHSSSTPLSAVLGCCLRLTCCSVLSASESRVEGQLFPFKQKRAQLPHSNDREKRERSESSKNIESKHTMIKEQESVN